MAKLNDLTNKIFGQWKVLKRVENNKNGYPQWLCECQCEKKTIKIVNTTNLINGFSKSCGCIVKERMQQLNKKYNTYDLTGEYGIGYTTKGEEFYFDLKDYDKIKDYCWCKSVDGYIVTTIHIEDKKTYRLFMHRLILNINNPKIYIDHENHNIVDNRRNNIRECTTEQNQWNRRTNKNNASGIKGVMWDEEKQKWRVVISVNSKKIHMGYFTNKSDAIKVRKEAEEFYYTDFNYNKNNDFLNEVIK